MPPAMTQQFTRWAQLQLRFGLPLTLQRPQLAISRNYATTHHEKKKILIIGSNGALGSAVASHLKQHHNCLTIGADITATEPSASSSLDAFLLISPNDTASTLQSGMRTLHNDTDPLQLDAIICTNGGFAEDCSTNPSSTHLQMMQTNYHPVIAAASLLSTYMAKQQGLFCAIGATAALAPSAPNQTAYGASKAAVHHYLHSLGVMTGLGLGGSRAIKKTNHAIQRMKENEYLDTLTVLGILPNLLDTEANRNTMPDTNADSWTKPMDLAMEIGHWISRPEFRPHSGSLLKALTKKVSGQDREEYRTEFHLVR